MLPEIPEINRLLGAYGTTVFARPEAPVPESWTKSAARVTRSRRTFRTTQSACC